MKNLLFVLSFIGSSQIVVAQKIFSVQYQNQADLKVFVVDYSNQADLHVYRVDYSNQAQDNKGLWFFSDYSNQADAKVFFVDYQNQAGWVNKTKIYMLE